MKKQKLHNRQDHYANSGNGNGSAAKSRKISFDSSRERNIISLYTESTGSKVQIFDCNYHPVNDADDYNIEQSICAHCNCGNGNGGCREMHINAMRESSAQGKSVVYRCNLSLMFWTSPIYRNGFFYGALRGSGYMHDEDGEKNFEFEERTGFKEHAAACNGTISEEEFTWRLSGLPAGDSAKINSLAEMLSLCAESLSTGSDNYHRLLKLRCEQQDSLFALVNELEKKYPAGSKPPAYPLAKEHRLIALTCQGNTSRAKKILNEILAVLLFNGRDQFKYVQFKSMEMAILLARAETNSGGGFGMEYNMRCLKQIHEAKTVEELIGILHSQVEDIAQRINTYKGIPHASAMRKSEQFIRENLHRKMSLTEIAKVAGLSAPYFSSIFKNEMGENLSTYINRLRVEKASKLLRETNLSLSEISGECCFEDQSWFSRIFKAYTGVSPGKYCRQAS